MPDQPRPGYRTAYQRAYRRAMARLARMYPDVFARLLAEEREKQGSLCDDSS